MTSLQSFGEDWRRMDEKEPKIMKKGIYKRTPHRKTQKKNSIDEFPFLVR